MKKVFKELAQPIDVSFIVKQEIATQFSDRFHFHNGYEFIYIIHGRGKFYGGNMVMNFTEGDVYFFGPMFPHCFVVERSSVLRREEAHAVIIQFKHDFLGRDVFEKPEFHKVKKLLQIVQSSGFKFTSPNKATEGLFTELTKPGLKPILLLLDLLDRITLLPDNKVKMLPLGPYGTIEKQHGFSKLNDVYRYVLENFKEEVSFQKAAALVFMNEAAFCRYFKRQAGKTFSQFVNQVRVIHATSLLHDNNQSVAKICYECGFNNLSNFNRQFKIITGQSPLVYRKQCNKS